MKKITLLNKNIMLPVCLLFLSLVGYSQTQEINIQGNAITIVDGDTTPSTLDLTDFGPTQILSTPLLKNFTIQNSGNTNLILTGSPLISISGSTDFSVFTFPNKTIAGKSSTTFQIHFNPSSLGTKTAIVSIANNDANENPYNFSIQGAGTQTFFDSDGDSVYDNIDIDDDNDGIRDSTEEINCNKSNGTKVNYKFLYETFGFGSRTTINTTYNAITTYCYEGGTAGANTAACPTLSDISMNDGEYTVGSSAQISSWATTHWYKGKDHTGDTNGRMALFNASYTPGIFYTAAITGALPNIPLTYSFWVLNLDRTDAPGIATRLRPNIRVEFRDINDNLLNSIITGPIAPTSSTNTAGNWVQFTANITLNVSSFKVIFINNETGGLGNDLALDDILITQKLCDLDNDGIADLYDLDADNDGIEDVIEAGLGNLSNGKGKIDAAWTDSNGNGLHDSAEPISAIAALDSDGDGIPNYLDLDSDNDSLFDVDESKAGNTNAVAGFVNGDGDINGDGTGDGPESEVFRSKDINGDSVAESFGDGILDIYDYGTVAGATSNITPANFKIAYGNSNQGTATANPATTYLKDTDTDGIPDYLDLKSNGSSFDITTTLIVYDYKTLDTNNDGIIDGTTDIDKDGILDLFDTNTAYFGSPRDLRTKLFLDFDGRNDYGQSTAILGGLPNASLMAWINLNPAFSADGVIVGQDKFQIRITAAKKLEAVVNGTTITFATALNVAQWYNVAAVYDDNKLKLYLNGALVADKVSPGGIAADLSLLIIGKNPVGNSKYFKGKIDEVRVFNVALTDSQLQRMVYQEIEDNGSEIRGLIVPKNIATAPASLPFANLLRYYRMDNYKDDIIDDLTTAAIDLTGTKIYNHKIIDVQQAPMPFVTERNGSFATAVNSPVKEIRGADIMEQDWSIVKVQHDITETANNIDLGMFVDSGKNIVMNNNTKIQNDWYLKLDGKIDLVGKSQLVQTIESDLDVKSSGYLEKDQEGQSNLFSYNYWSSPVSPINMVSNNKDYNIDGVFKDGTTKIPQNIQWIGGFNGAPTTPISLTTYWLYKFDNYANAYANWARITEKSPLRVGQGFTMKGSGSASGTQNYTFVGKPNNGSITTNIVSAEQLLLVGNPYPSALDAFAFINDNLNSIDRLHDKGLNGTIYFWEHSSTNKTHILANYLGGYAVLNLSGGLPPVVPKGIKGVGASAKRPKQYIPVGQGFLVFGKTGGGGPVVFNNGQRTFQRESDAVSNTLFKVSSNPKKENSWNNNDNDPVKKDTLKRIRLGFESYNEYHRQVLLAFMGEKASSEIDYGYDGYLLDDFPNDMYLLNRENELVIQGEGFFDPDATYAIAVKTDAEGPVKFLIDELENFSDDQPIFLYDDDTKIYHNIRKNNVEINLPKGKFNSRFSLRFKDKTLGTNEENGVNNTIRVTHLKNENLIVINNDLPDVLIKEVTLYNIVGQSVSNWKVENQQQKNIQLPIKKLTSGVYILKIQTTKEEFSKKIIII